MLVLVTAVGMVTVAMVSGTGATQFCCSPKQWGATVRTLRQTATSGGSVEHHSTWQFVTYDAKSQRVAEVTFMRDDAPTFTRQILDYSKGERYVIQGSDQEKCSRHPLTRTFQGACAGATGNVTGVYFAVTGGSLGENTVYVTQPDVTSYVTVTIGDCALVQETSFGKIGADGSERGAMAEFWNSGKTRLKQELDRQNDHNIPRSCRLRLHYTSSFFFLFCAPPDLYKKICT
ncbi:hypothetical protein BaRGS_00035147 [Batillaria attramentaria]|uniref:Salivary lipocalin n=1 Tax=Batillaria attramentaria TaxID=370345 RepID=A0ABD0JFA2_9CAEN